MTTSVGFDPYEKQKEAYAQWACFVWIGSGIYLFLATPGVSLFSLRAAGFLLVGMFAASLTLGLAGYGLQRGIAWVLVKAIRGFPSRTVAGLIGALGWVLFLVETVIGFQVARWTFHQII